MKLSSSVWLHVCLYLVLNAGAVSTVSAATVSAANAGDVPVAVRSPDDIDRKLAVSTAVSDVEVLERARAANGDVYSSLESFVCSEEINRFKGSLNSQSAHALDTVTAKLFSNAALSNTRTSTRTTVLAQECPVCPAPGLRVNLGPYSSRLSNCFRLSKSTLKLLPILRVKEPLFITLTFQKRTAPGILPSPDDTIGSRFAPTFGSRQILVKYSRSIAQP